VVLYTGAREIQKKMRYFAKLSLT